MLGSLGLASLGTIGAMGAGAAAANATGAGRPVQSPQASPQNQAGAAGQVDMDSAAQALLQLMSSQGDPWQNMARTAQGVRFYRTPEREYLPRHYNTAPASPLIGPGIMGLQGLIQR